MNSSSETLAEESNVDIEQDSKVNIKGRSPDADGDAFAWVQAIGAFFLMFNTWGLVNTFGVFQTAYQTKVLEGTSASTISWIGSLQTCLLLSGTVVVGPLVDRGYLRPILLLGSFLVVFGMMMASLSHEYWEALLSQGLVVGLGFSCLFPPSVTIIPQYFKKRRVLALGVSAAGSSIGAIIYTITFEQLEPKIGFGWATRVIGFLALATLLVPSVGMKWQIHDPKAPIKVDPKIFGDVSFSVAAAATFFGFLGVYIPFFYIELYSSARHAVSHHLNAYLLPIMNAGSFFGRLIPPYIAGKIGSVNTIVVCTFSISIMGFCWIAVDNTGGTIAFCLLYGFFSGGFMALTGAIVGALSPDPKQMGLRLGMFLLPASIGVVIGTPIAGAILKSGWLGLQLFCGATTLVAGILYVVARVWKTGWDVMVRM